jgi:hypothetical protein
MTPRPLMLNLDQFDSPSKAKVAIKAQRVFDREAHSALNEAVGLTILTMFVMSAVVRARGLYEGIVREIQHDNPHAVFPLMRQFAETVAMAFYVADHPEYADVITERERDKPAGTRRRKTIQALIGHVEKVYAPQFGDVYAELSEVAHFGTVAMWIAHRLEGESGGTSWSSIPRWRDDRQLYVACAQLLELREAMSGAIRQLGEAVQSDPGPVIGSFSPPSSA